MKAIVNGELICGLIQFPIGVCGTVKKTNEPSFKTLHAECSTPVSVKRGTTVSVGEELRWCKTCDHEVTEVIYGFEYAKGQFVLFTEKEREELKAERSPVIELRKVCADPVIKPMMTTDAYYLQPNDHMAEHYALMYQTLAKHKLVGFGAHTLWGKEHPCAVQADNGVMVLTSLRLYEDLVAPDFEAPIPHSSAKTQKLAEQAILSMKEDFKPVVDLFSEQRQHMQSVIAAKIEGAEPPKMRDVSREDIPDINAALEKMVADAQKKKKPAKKAAPKPATPAKKPTRKKAAA